MVTTATGENIANGSKKYYYTVILVVLVIFALSTVPLFVILVQANDRKTEEVSNTTSITTFTKN